MHVARWTRFGHDRLYVRTDTGEAVGWLDLRTGTATLDRPDLAEGFHEAVAAYRGVAEIGVQPSASASANVMASIATVVPSKRGGSALPEPRSEPAIAEWQDLALNRPGQGVRAEADALLSEMKSHSKLRTFLARAVDAKTDERAFRVGAEGEEAVGPRLERLTKRGWHVLHSVPVGDRGSDIDHLLIGPGGVYTVNTKKHPGGRVWVGEHAIRVNGQPTHYLRNSRFEAQRVTKTLLRRLGHEVPARAVLVFLTGTVVPQVAIKQMPADVLVLDRMDIPGVFKRAPQRLSPEQIDRIFEIARRSTTWSR
jgi:hypothetical protein